VRACVHACVHACVRACVHVCVHVCVCDFTVTTISLLGAFGIVHKGELISADGAIKAVAIKTIKCKCHLMIDAYFGIAKYFNVCSTYIVKLCLAYVY